ILAGSPWCGARGCMQLASGTVLSIMTVNSRSRPHDGMALRVIVRLESFSSPDGVRPRANAIDSAQSPPRDSNRICGYKILSRIPRFSRNAYTETHAESGPLLSGKAAKIHRGRRLSGFHQHRVLARRPRRLRRAPDQLRGASPLVVTRGNSGCGNLQAL